MRTRRVSQQHVHEAFCTNTSGTPVDECRTSMYEARNDSLIETRRDEPSKVMNPPRA